MKEKQNWEKEFVKCPGHKRTSGENKQFICPAINQEQKEERENLLNDYSDWLHKEGFIDDDYYTVCFRKATGDFLKHLLSKNKK